MSGPLLRFRTISYVVGTVLVLFLLVAMPLKYAAGVEDATATISQVHGVLYMLYLVATVLLARAAGWTALRTLGVMLAGTVPFLSFVVERRVTRELSAG